MLHLAPDLATLRMSTRPLDSAAALDPDRHFTIQDALNAYALADQPTHLGRQVKHALGVVETALDRYSLDQLALSFNGGKDCTVLVHLLAAAVLVRSSRTAPNGVDPRAIDPPPASSPQDSSTLPRILAVYVRCVSPFPQVEDFVTLCARWYHLELDAVEGGMKEALQTYLDRRRTLAAATAAARSTAPRRRRSVQDGAPEPTANGKEIGVDGDGTEEEQIKAIMVGTRRTDPHGATLTPFVPTDPTWPDFMRVHPILDWSYKDVWDFLRHPDLTLGAVQPAVKKNGAGAVAEAAQARRTALEWCELYDYGYTSLGSTYNTFPNPLLRSTASGTLVDGGADSLPLGGWRPAWELEDEDAERAGRDPNLAHTVGRSAKLPQLPDELASRTATNGDSGAVSALPTFEEPDLPIGSCPNSRAASPETVNIDS